jgi:hypothetical protein
VAEKKKLSEHQASSSQEFFESEFDNGEKFIWCLVK